MFPIRASVAGFDCVFSFIADASSCMLSTGYEREVSVIQFVSNGFAHYAHHKGINGPVQPCHSPTSLVIDVPCFGACVHIYPRHLKRKRKVFLIVTTTAIPFLIERALNCNVHQYNYCQVTIRPLGEPLASNAST